MVALSGRIVESVPLGGQLVRKTETGDPAIEDPPSASGQRGPGIGFQLGLLVRLGPVFPRPEPTIRTLS